LADLDIQLRTWPCCTLRNCDRLDSAGVLIVYFHIMRR